MDIVLKAERITKYYRAWAGVFRRGSSIVKAVDGVDLALERGKTLGLVGESGCGKSTLARVLMRLEEPTSGRIYIDGEDFLAFRGKALRRERRKIQMIFQDPYSSLNPRLTVGSTIAEGIKIHKIAKGKEVRERVMALLAKVGLPPSAENKFPHEFSGGQRQRIGIARALAVEPEIIIADEPVSALDVSVRAQIINLIKDIQEETGVSMIFIAHDLGVVKNVSDTLAVMYLGKIVELAETDAIFREPLHPYTKGLLASIPVADPDAPVVRAAIDGDVPSAAKVPPGCSFHPRCPEVMERCTKEPPRLVEIGSNRLVRCWLHNE
ncbi:peptide ABC transporter substrate-binding protein [bacterium]|nr:MAG: peptide ABC transporter substrate-binding protein [bacterium]